MFFKQIKVGEMDNFNYIIADQKSKIAAVVDPSFEPQTLLKIAKEHNLNIKIILLTHTHYDHVDAVDEIEKQTDAIIYVHKNEAKALHNDNVKEITDNQTIMVGDIEVKVIFTPGHTQGSVVYKVENKLITGDTLFIEGCGRTDLPGGSTETLFNSIKKIKTLPDNTIIYPGHDYGTTAFSTLKDEKVNNRFLRAETLKEFTEERD